MYTKLQAYNELGEFIHKILDTPRTAASMEAIELLEIERRHLLHGRFYGVHEKRPAPHTVPPRKPTAPTEIPPVRPPEHHGHHDLQHLPFAAMVMDLRP